MNDKEDNVKYDETWLHRYQQKKLSNEELEEYELYLLDHPEHVEEVELEESITDSLNFLRSQDKYYEIIERKREVKKKLVVSNLMTLAACVLVAVLLSFTVLKDAPISEAKLVYLESYRSYSGNDLLPKIELAQEHKSLVLLVPLLPDNKTTGNDIFFRHVNSMEDLIIHSPTSNEDGELVLSVHSGSLKTGDYEVFYKDTQGKRVILAGVRIIKT